MLIWVGFTKIEVQVIEWADSTKSRPVAFLFNCPHCNKKQWNRIDNFYMGFDGTKRNLRCKYCYIGKAKPGDHLRRTENQTVFNPKNVGWCSTSGNCAKRKCTDKESEPN